MDDRSKQEKALAREYLRECKAKVQSLPRFAGQKQLVMGLLRLLSLAMWDK